MSLGGRISSGIRSVVPSYTYVAEDAEVGSSQRRARAEHAALISVLVGNDDIVIL